MYANSAAFSVIAVFAYAFNINPVFFSKYMVYRWRAQNENFEVDLLLNNVFEK